MNKEKLLNMLLTYEAELDDKCNGMPIDDIAKHEVQRAMSIVIGVLCRDVMEHDIYKRNESDRNNWGDKRSLKTHSFKATWTEYQEEWADNFSMD